MGYFRPRGYQQAAVDAVLSEYYNGASRLLLHLPTGAGKTVIGSLLIDRFASLLGGAKTLFVAHRQEILEQTAEAIRRQLPKLTVAIEQGAKRAPANADVIVASVQSLVGRKERFEAEHFGLIICDECHRALAPTWVEVIEHFTQARSQKFLLLGMTATPKRSDGRSVLDVFERVAFDISRTELQDMGYLTPMRYFGVYADLQLDKVRISAGDFQVSSLSKAMNTPKNRALTLNAWQQEARSLKTIAFCAGVQHARQLAADFEQVFGVRAATVDAKSINRKKTIGPFAMERFKYLPTTVC